MKFRRTCALSLVVIVAIASSAFAQSIHDHAIRTSGRIAANSLPIGTYSIYLSGTVSYSQNATTAVLKADSVTNSNSTATGPLRLSLWWTTSPFPSAGHNTAQYAITNSLAAGASIAPVNGSGTTVPFTQPPTGCYWVSLVLEEQVSGTWTTRDYLQFSKSADWQAGCIASFSAAPASISSGASSTLSWSLLGTAIPVIDNGIGTQPQNGSKSVSPPSTTTYTLSSTNTANSAPWTRQVTVTVAPPQPTITNISPTHGPATGGNSATITGTNLTGATSVTFGSTAATLGTNSGTSLAVTVPAHSPGPVIVTVTTPGGTATTSYTFDATAPTISGISPAHGPVAGGNFVTISGTNLSGATSVTFGNTAATLGTNNGTSLAVVAPAHSAGAVTVTVTTSGGTATTSYTYDAANAPAISSISPSSGPTSGGQTVTITGTNFGSGNVVAFDGIAATILNGTSTSIQVRTPPHAAGAVSVTVTMSSGVASGAYTYVESMRIVSVVGSTAGSFGSFFRTSLQMHNNGTGPVSGTMAFHPTGTAGPGDPTLPFSLTPGQTKSIDDLVASLNASGVGTLDINSDDAGSLLFSSRIYNDAGANGTTGMSIDPVAPSDALQQGDTALLLVPADSGARFNVGVRTLAAGATLQVTLLNADGSQHASTSHTYAANSFAQTSVADFAGATPGPNEAIVIDVSAGSAIVYGAMTDNKTQDPTYQTAKSVAALRNRGAIARLVIPVVGSVAGSFNSFFRTSLQMHNGGAATLTGAITFHPQAASASPGDPSKPYSIAPGQTISFNDIVSTIGASGIGSLDLTSSDFPSLLVLARIYNDAGANGTTGMGLDPMAPADALQSGDTGVLLAPAHVDVFRYNVGVRTLDAGASVQFTVIDGNGNTKQATSRTFGADFFQQYGAADLLGTSVAANDAILISVNSGSLIVYGATTDNRTQDPTYAIARRR